MKTLFIAALFLSSLSQASTQATRCVAIDGPNAGGNSSLCHTRTAANCELVNECQLLRARDYCVAARYTPYYVNCEVATRESNCLTMGCDWRRVWR